MKHLCPGCGAFIRWGLLLCFECNHRLRESGGTAVVGDEHIYPPHNVSN